MLLILSSKTGENASVEHLTRHKGPVSLFFRFFQCLDIWWFVACFNLLKLLFYYSYFRFVVLNSMQLHHIYLHLGPTMVKFASGTWLILLSQLSFRLLRFVLIGYRIVEVQFFFSECITHFSSNMPWNALLGHNLLNTAFFNWSLS